MSGMHVLAAATVIRGLEMAERLVLICLSNRMFEETRLCIPSIETIAGDMEISPATAKRALAGLEEKGLIRRINRRVKGVQRSTAYELLFDPVVKKTTHPPLTEEEVETAIRGSNRATAEAQFEPEPELNLIPSRGSNRATNLTRDNLTREDTSEANASSAAKAQFDPDADAWAAGRRLLASRAEMTDAQSGKFIGQLLAKNKIQARELYSAIAAASANSTADPKSYLSRAAEKIGARTNSPPSGYAPTRRTDPPVEDRWGVGPEFLSSF
jgi:DNA-binding transcriptional regulator YhcF (GntR family)